MCLVDHCLYIILASQRVTPHNQEDVVLTSRSVQLSVFTSKDILISIKASRYLTHNSPCKLYLTDQRLCSPIPPVICKGSEEENKIKQVSNHGWSLPSLCPSNRVNIVK